MQPVNRLLPTTTRKTPLPHIVFFFSVEDGIRGGHVTGVQTCALPIFAGQWLFAKVLRWVPYSGWTQGWDAVRFLILPVLVGILSRLGAEARFFRSLFLEEAAKDYIRTARAKGLSEVVVLYRHLLRNALLPILTGAVTAIPLLFMGSLISESFFGIPGLGSYTIEAINAQDLSIVRAMVFLGSALYIVGLVLADVSYTLVDPRVRFS